MRRIAVCLAALALMVGCVPPAPHKTQLEIREFQTRTYDTTDTGMVTQAVLSALQDDGFVIKSANTDVGLIMAGKEKSTWVGIWRNVRLHQSWECSVNVTKFGDQTKVRVNFQIAADDGAGHPLDVHAIKTTWPLAGAESVAEDDDPIYYQEFFAKVDKSIFIEKEHL